LITVLLAGFVGNQLEAIPGILSEYTYFLAGDKAAGNKPDTEQIADPLGIFGVVLVPADGLDPFGIGDGDVYGILQQVGHGNPIFPGRFHTDVPAVILQQPGFESKDFVVECGETPFFVFWFNAFGSDKGGDKKRFVDIHTATDGVNNVQNFPSSK